ncbi:MAG: heme lyase CcmF/NrfE family subunit [Henriciella sp.]|nr:heme lyase CcmF/NrfE family subunit [Henriciella sp.]MBO6696468.1 heme lyase CcmF/NrfE family subunit [Henriciella sp.]
MLAEIGQIALILALFISALQAWMGLHGAHIGDRRAMVFADRGAIAQALLCILAFGLLAYAFMVSDFSVQLVTANSHTSKPMIYKFSGTWGNHEGSMLLWVMIMALFGAAMVWFGKTLPAGLRARAIGVQGLTTTGFLAFLIFSSNPFTRMSPIPENGVGLNPLLQDPGLAIHPPFLYLGYVGFSVAFSFAVAALIEGRVDAMWARWVRPWVLLAWSFLTIGIVLGSVWAYYELGWGGWWFWDPVENVSFMPWLAGTALLHSTLVAQARGSFIRWTLLLAITTFSLSLVGTFIVRSGVLTSVHAFAVDPGRGIFILALLVLATGGALFLYALRSGRIAHGAGFQLQSRESGLVLNNVLLVVSTATVFLGTFYPLVIDAMTGDKITVGPPYFERTFGPIMAVLIIFMAVAPLLKWRADNWRRIQKALLIMLALAVPTWIAVAAFGNSVLGGLGIALAVWLLTGSVFNYARKLRIGDAKSTAGNLLKRFAILPGAAHGFALAHIGLALTTIGVVSMGVWADEEVDRLKLGESISVAGYEFRLEDVRRAQGPNYISETGQVVIERNGRRIGVLNPEQRMYPVERNNTTEGAMEVGATRILYAAKGDGNLEDGWVVSVYYHPMVIWIWIGALMMAFGGLIAVADRRHAYANRKAPVPQAVAAE